MWLGLHARVTEVYASPFHVLTPKQIEYIVIRPLYPSLYQNQIELEHTLTHYRKIKIHISRYSPKTNYIIMSQWCGNWIGEHANSQINVTEPSTVSESSIFILSSSSCCSTLLAFQLAAIYDVSARKDINQVLEEPHISISILKRSSSSSPPLSAQPRRAVPRSKCFLPYHHVNLQALLDYILSIDHVEFQ